MKHLITPGRCSACKAAAERGPSGAWWHRDDASCRRHGARFEPDEDTRQQQPPHDRQISHPPEDR